MFKVVLILALVAAASAMPRKFFGRGTPGRIVGGVAASPNEFPYMLSLQYFGSHLCGAAIIRSSHILTAAHCAAQVGPANSFTVKAGKHNIRETESTEQTREIESLVIHPGYPGEESGSGFSHDIAVMKVKTPFVFNGYVAPIPLAPSGHVASGNVSILGWGTTREGGSYPDILQKAEVPIVTDAACRQAFGANIIEDSMICAGLAQGGVDSCAGDSGGPMTATDRGYRYLAGLTSFGYGCARPGYPGVYSEVAAHTDFINANAI